MSRWNDVPPALANGVGPALGNTDAIASGAELLRHLLDRLSQEGIPFCSWTGPIDSARVARGEGDLDLLVDRSHAGRFEGVAASLGFRAAQDPLEPPTPGVTHWYGLDAATGAFIHLHVHYQLVLGGGWDYYSLPLAHRVLQSCQVVGGIPVPARPAQLVLFVLRTMVKHSSWSVRLLSRRHRDVLRAKLAALKPEEIAGPAADLLADWLPGVSGALFRRCLGCLQNLSWRGHRFWLGRALRRQLRSFRRVATPLDRLVQMMGTARLAYRALCGGAGRKDLASGGAVIAFVGPDAAGKSTLVRETRAWLAPTFRVTAAHLGKPPSTWLTWLPNTAGRWFLRARRRAHPAGADHSTGTRPRRPGLGYALRAVLVAWDRRALAMKLRRRAASGRIIVCDRYPSAQVGAMDSARLDAADPSAGRLARLENRLYRAIPAPDVVVRLRVPVAVALERNRQRAGSDKGHETEAYVRHRHTAVPVPVFPGARTVDLDMTQPPQVIAQTLRQTLWRLL